MAPPPVLPAFIGRGGGRDLAGAERCRFARRVSSTAAVSARAGQVRAGARAGSRPWPWWWWGCLAALLAWALLPVALILARSLAGEGAVTGAYGLHPADQYQYMS